MRTRRGPLRCSPGVFLLLLVVACTGAPEEGASDRPNLLVVSIDSLRWDHINAAGYSRDVSPELDAFLREGTWFTQAISTAPWTTPSMISAMTGLEPLAHRVQAPGFTLAPSAETLAERLQSEGYRTLAVVPSVTLGRHFGFSQGFERYEAFNFGHNKLTARRLNTAARRLLEARDSRPWFLWIHYWDPHYNYEPPEPEASRYPSSFRPPPGKHYNVAEIKRLPAPLSEEEVEFLISQYDGEIRYNDRFLGELLDLLGERGEKERTLVVLLADHGEAFQEHGWLGHTNRVDETLIHVPLAFRWPGVVREGAGVETQVGLVDLLPTVLDLLEVPYREETLMGRSLAPTLREGTPPPERALAAMTVRRGAWYALRRPPLKYVLDFESCEERLFDLAADPGESRDLAAERPEALASMALEATRRLELSERLALPVIRPQTEDETVLEQLRSLGYVAPKSDPLGDVSAESTELRPARCFTEDDR